VFKPDIEIQRERDLLNLGAGGADGVDVACDVFDHDRLAFDVHIPDLGPGSPELESRPGSGPGDRVLLRSSTCLADRP
jgi:hypothetical protein